MIVVTAPQPPADELTETIGIRCTKAEKDKANALAHAQGTSVSALVRHWIDEA